MVKTFGDFEFDDQRRSLKSGGQPVRLSGQGLDVLSLLLERPGELITREEIAGRLWPGSRVDVTHNLDVVVSRVRTVLGDSVRGVGGATPRYIETVPRKGYRFTEPVTARPEVHPVQSAQQVPSVREARAPRHWVGRLMTFAAVAIFAAIVAILLVRSRYDKFVPAQRSQVSPGGPAR